MDLETISDRLDDIAGDLDRPEQSVKLLMAKLGHIAEADVRLADMDIPEDDEEAASLKEDMHSDLFAGLIVAAIEYADQHDVDVSGAVEDRLGRMEEEMEQRQEIADAIESGDAQALAEALDADVNEVPTGPSEDPRGFQ